MIAYEILAHAPGTSSPRVASSNFIHYSNYPVDYLSITAKT